MQPTDDFELKSHREFRGGTQGPKIPGDIPIGIVRLFIPWE